MFNRARKVTGLCTNSCHESQLWPGLACWRCYSRAHVQVCGRETEISRQKNFSINTIFISHIGRGQLGRGGGAAFLWSRRNSRKFSAWGGVGGLTEGLQDCLWSD